MSFSGSSADQRSNSAAAGAGVLLRKISGSVGSVRSEVMRRFAPLVAGCALVSSCYVATHYSGWLYRGGRLVNNGLFSRPRYEAQFPRIPLDVPGSYEYTFSRFPAADALVMLATPSGPSVSSIERLTTSVRLRVVDQNNQVQCDATGSPGGKDNEQLIVTSSTGVLGLWHMGCARLQLRTCNPCRLSIVVGPVDPATPVLLLVPTVQGGGVELP
jgi:hypothetical protein